MNLQETQIDPESFNNCEHIISNFNMLINNAQSKYGTCSLIFSNIQHDNMRYDTAGRVIVIDLPDFQYTTGNVYLPCGIDQTARQKREEYSSLILPNLLLDRLPNGIVGGDWNYILSKKDYTKNPEVKMSPSLAALTHMFGMSDDFRRLCPLDLSMSHYYDKNGPGGTRIDRSYSYGAIKAVTAFYTLISFSDHHTLILSFELPANLEKSLSPKSIPLSKLNHGF